MSRFTIEGPQLLLKTPRHKVIVDNNITPDKLVALATDLTTTALLYRRAQITGVDYIWASELERKVIYFLSQDLPKKEIARRCGVHVRTIHKCVRRLRKKIDGLWTPRPLAKPPDQARYIVVKISEIPFSSLAPVGGEDDETLEYEPSDAGQAAADIYRQLELGTDLENSDTFRKLTEKKQRALARLLAQGLSREECAQNLGVSIQAVHQMIGRMKRKLRQ